LQREKQETGASPDDTRPPRRHPGRRNPSQTGRRAIELSVNFIDTADSYGPHVSEELISEALHPYPDDLVIATKGGLERTGPGQWPTNGRPEHLIEACVAEANVLAKLIAGPSFVPHRSASIVA
jgi:aryl-alcohol dehydrogenase-like predicted oxidoreductase